MKYQDYIENLSEKLAESGYRHLDEGIPGSKQGETPFGIFMFRVTHSHTRVVASININNLEIDSIKNIKKNLSIAIDAIKPMLNVKNWKIYAEVIFCFSEEISEEKLKNITKHKDFSFFQQFSFLPIAVDLSRGNVFRYFSPPFGGDIEKVAAAISVKYGARKRLSSLGLGALVTAPIATYIVSALCVMYYALLSAQVMFSDQVGRGALISYGAMSRPFVQLGEYWRLVTAALVHIDIMHFIINIYAFFILGVLAENLLGWKKFVSFFLLGTIGANVTGYFFGGFESSAGLASGSFALIGVLAAHAALSREHDFLLLRFKTLLPVAIFIIYHVALGARGDEGFSQPAHIGGLVTGFVLSVAMWKKDTAVAGSLPAIVLRGELGSLQIDPGSVRPSKGIWKRILPGLWGLALVVMLIISGYGPEKHYVVAERAIARENYNLARESLGRYLALRPDSPSAWAALGEVNLVLEDYARAFRAFERSVSLDSGSVAAHYGMGESLFQLGLRQKSIPLLSESAKSMERAQSLAARSQENEALLFSSRQRAALVRKAISRLKLKTRYGRR